MPSSSVLFYCSIYSPLFSFPRVVAPSLLSPSFSQRARARPFVFSLKIHLSSLPTRATFEALFSSLSLSFFSLNKLFSSSMRRFSRGAPRKNFPRAPRVYLPRRGKFARERPCHIDCISRICYCHLSLESERREEPVRCNPIGLFSKARASCAAKRTKSPSPFGEDYTHSRGIVLELFL